MKLNDFIDLFKWIEKTSGMPFWAVLTISGVCLLFIFAYGFFIPISIMVVKKNLATLIKDLSDVREEVHKNLQGYSSKYRWKS